MTILTQITDWIAQHGLQYLIIGLCIFWPGYLLGKYRNTGNDGVEIISNIIAVITWWVVIGCVLNTLFS